MRHIHFLALLLCIFLAATAGQAETPSVPMDEAISLVKHHIVEKKVDVSNRYIGRAEWHSRSGLMSFWRVEWWTADSGSERPLVMNVFADNKIEVEAESKAAPSTRLSKQEAIRIAAAAATKKGYRVADYSPPTADFELAYKDGTWTVSFIGKVPAPGRFFLVVVYDKSGKTEVFPGI